MTLAFTLLGRISSKLLFNVLKMVLPLAAACDTFSTGYSEVSEQNDMDFCHYICFLDLIY